MPELATLCYLTRGGEVLLILKKRGLGRGLYNGVGGRVREGEGVYEAAAREVWEEVGVRVRGLEYRGVLEFHAGGVDPRLVVYVFVSRDYEGEPRETEEAAPRWFGLDSIPYDRMWEDDRLWLPTVLSGGCVLGRFFFGPGFRGLRSWLLYSWRDNSCGETMARTHRQPWS